MPLVYVRPAQNTARECVLCGPQKHFKVSQHLNFVFSVFHLLYVIESILNKCYFFNYYVTVTFLMIHYSMFVRSSCRLIAHDLNLDEQRRASRIENFTILY